MQTTPAFIEVFRAETSKFSRTQPRTKGRFKKQLLVNRTVVKQPLDFGKAQSTPRDGWGRIKAFEFCKRIAWQIPPLDTPAAKGVERFGIVGQCFSSSSLVLEHPQGGFDFRKASDYIAKFLYAERVLPPSELPLPFAGMDRYYVCGFIPETGRCGKLLFHKPSRLTMEEKAHDAPSDP